MSENGKADKPLDSTPEEREINGVDMSDAREINEEMKKEYEHPDEQKTDENRNEKKEADKGSKMNQEEV